MRLKDEGLEMSNARDLSDWELHTEASPSNAASDLSNWEADNGQHKEGFLQALGMAPRRIGGDIGESLRNAYHAVPDLYEKSKTEVPGMFSALEHHPLHALGQALAGSQEAINTVAQLPKEVTGYAANRLHLLPESIANFVSKTAPEDTSESVNRLFGEPKYEGEGLIRGAIRNLPELAGAGKLATTLNPLKLTDKAIIKDILGTKEKMQDLYETKYNELWKKAESKGLGGQLIEKPEIDIDVLRKYSPKKDIDAVEDFIKNPTLENSHFAKSDLLAIQRRLDKMTTLRSAERKQAKAVSDAINNIQNNMFKTSEGLSDPELLNEYNSVQSGYRNEVVPYKNKAINAYKNKELTDKELINSLSRGKFAAQRGQYHGIQTKENIKKALLGVGLGGGAYEAFHGISNLFSNKNSG